MKLNPYSRGGFTLVEIMIVVSIIGLLSAIAVPNFVRARNTSQADACLNNLRQLDSALQQWALENSKDSGDAPNPGALGAYLRGGALPTCPVGLLAYNFGVTIGTVPAVSCPNVVTLPSHALP